MYLAQSYHSGSDPEKLMEIVDRAAAAIKDWIAAHPEADVTHIACMGISGQAIAWPVSYKLGISVVVARKKGEPSNSDSVVGYGELRGYVVVDDLISSGDTMNNLIGAIHGAYMEERDAHQANTGWEPIRPMPAMPVCKAIFLTQSCYNPDFDYKGTRVPVIDTRNQPT